jgi:hypothetical protein
MRRWADFPEVFEAGQIIAQAREMRPDIPIVARAHSVDEVEHLKGLGADIVVSAERELGRGMLKRLGEIAPDTLDLANRADLPAIETPRQNSRSRSSQRPSNRAGRFSRNAATPSMKSRLYVSTGQKHALVAARNQVCNAALN